MPPPLPQRKGNKYFNEEHGEQVGADGAATAGAEARTGHCHGEKEQRPGIAGGVPCCWIGPEEGRGASGFKLHKHITEELQWQELVKQQPYALLSFGFFLSLLSLLLCHRSPASLAPSLYSICFASPLTWALTQHTCSMAVSSPSLQAPYQPRGQGPLWKQKPYCSKHAQPLL